MLVVRGDYKGGGIVFENFITSFSGGVTALELELLVGFTSDMELSNIDLTQWQIEINGTNQGNPNSSSSLFPSLLSLKWAISGLDSNMIFRIKYSGNDVNFKSVSGVRQSGFDWVTFTA